MRRMTPSFNGRRLSVVVAALLSSGVAFPQSVLPARAQADVLNAQLERAIQKHDVVGALNAVASYRARVTPVPVNILFAEARFAAEQKDYLRALRALQDYFASVKSDDGHYRAAVQLYPRVEEGAQHALAEQEQTLSHARQNTLAHVAPEYRPLIDSLLSSMVVVSAGQFQMGDLVGRGDADEKPVHWVRIREFLLAKYEVTFDQYDLFSRATSRDLPEDSGWGRGRRPVINVSWDDAQAFIGWLREVSGVSFRLPSEAELEYAERAGTITEYPWGSENDPSKANGKTTKTTEVGYYPANAWGLYDIIGNVWEWAADCYKESYVGAPTDGSAWTWPGCARHVMRGGSWNDEPAGLRVSNREMDHSTNRFNVLGLRLALDH
jgi:formylglycine-generating enzyme required for sulfatase activity